MSDPVVTSAPARVCPWCGDDRCSKIPRLMANEGARADGEYLFVCPACRNVVVLCSSGGKFAGFRRAEPGRLDKLSGDDRALIDALREMEPPPRRLGRSDA